MIPSVSPGPDPADHRRGPNPPGLFRNVQPEGSVLGIRGPRSWRTLPPGRPEIRKGPDPVESGRLPPGARLQQAFRVVVADGGGQLVRGEAVDDAALPHDDDAVGDPAHDLDVVADEQYAEAVHRLEPQQERTVERGVGNECVSTCRYRVSSYY